MTTRVLAIEAGRVQCPEAGPVDLERCLTCRRFRAVRDGDRLRAAAVECSPVRKGLTATWAAYVDVAGHLPG